MCYGLFMTTTKSKGSKYEATRHLDTTAVAALVRAEVKALLRGLPKGFKVSVRTSYASMMSAIDLRVTAVPAGFSVGVSEEQTDDNRLEGLARPWLTRAAHALLGQLEDLVDAYNRVESDGQTDYYSTRFFASVEFAGEVLRADKGRRLLAVSEHLQAEVEAAVERCSAANAEVEARVVRAAEARARVEETTALVAAKQAEYDRLTAKRAEEVAAFDEACLRMIELARKTGAFAGQA
jgi:hypothetical protein